MSEGHAAKWRPLFAETEQNEMAVLCVRALVSERLESLLKRLPFLISGSGPEQLIRENYLAIIRSSCNSTRAGTKQSLSL